MMEYSNLIHEFTDGTLEVNREDELFRLLANNDEYRGEFKEQLAMKSAIRLDSKAYTPTAASTLKIFSSVGLTPPLPVPSIGTGVATSGGISNSLGFFGKYWTNILTGMIATLATAVIAYFIFSSQMGDLISKNNELNSTLISAKKKSEIPVISSFDNKESISKNSNRTGQNNSNAKPVIKYIYITKPAPVADVQGQSTNVNSESTNADSDLSTGNSSLGNSAVLNDNGSPALAINDNFIWENPEMASSIFGDYNKTKLYKKEFEHLNRMAPYEVDLGYLLAGSEDFGITIEWRNMETWHDINPTVHPKQYQDFNNSSITILYELLDNFDVGLEGRNETFFQQFNSVDDTLRYNQQPNFTSYGLVLRYNFDYLDLWGIYPYTQFYVGGTSVGLIERGMLGLRYSPYKGLNFIVGTEASMLDYKYSGKGYKSYKYDLNYGVSFGF